ncbi:MAG: 50S ribosomal protein L9, partial [Actinomycetota bacterium]
MKVILNSDVGSLGRKGDLVDVAPGYARNFLLPRNLAIGVTKGAMKQAEHMRRQREERDQREKAAAEALAGRIAGLRLRTSARAGDEGHLFGSITTAHIAELLSKALGEEVDRRKISLPEPVRSLGLHEYAVHVRADV